jgi:outer membrane protein assembly factor BamB
MKALGWILVALVFGISASTKADDWPQWRGPQRDGISREKGLMARWPEEGPRLLWQLHDIGDGYSTPAVVGERLYVMANRGMQDEFVTCLAVKDGSEIWTTRVGNVGRNNGPQYPGARSTPTVDGERIYALGSDGDLVCLETATGRIRWQKKLGGEESEFKGSRGKWAYAESPLVDGNVLVVTPGGKVATLVALDKQSGTEIWRSVVPEGDNAAYASIGILQADGVKQYVQFLENGVVGVDARTGKYLWRYNKTAEGSPANIPTPVISGNYVYSAHRRGGSALLNVKVEGSQVTAEEVYFERGLPHLIGGSVLIGKHLYGTTGQTLVCCEFLSGKIVWQDRGTWQDRGIAPASICYAEGHLYIHTEKGDVALVEATPEGYRAKGNFALPDQPERGMSQAWAHPVVANGRLYLRDLGKLWCYDVRDARADF